MTWMLMSLDGGFSVKDSSRCLDIIFVKSLYGLFALGLRLCRTATFKCHIMKNRSR
jgi:hypothetical protein